MTNPYSMDKMDEAIDRALALEPAEAERRMAAMYETVTKYDVQYWAKRLFGLFEETRGVNNPPELTAKS